MAGPRDHTTNAVSLDDFVAALRRPLEFLLNAPPATAARTHLPGTALALRARALADALPGDRRRTILESLAERLERFATVSTDQRGPLAQELWEGLERLTKKAPPPPYRVSTGDLCQAIEELKRPVQFVKGVGPRRADLLRKTGIETVEDLLFHLPFRYEDRRRVSRIADARPGEEASFIGELAQLSDRTVGRARRRILEGVVRDESGLLGLTWYNQVTYFRARYRVGQRCLVYGRVERTPAGGIRIVHPEIDMAPDESGPGILPVYNKPTTMTVGAMRKLVQQAVRDFADRMPSALPPQVTESAGLLDLAAALRTVHLPSADADVDELNEFGSAAHRSLVFDELFFLQLGLTMRRRETRRESGIAMPSPGRLTDGLLERLPFALTGAQQRVLADIRRDMAAPHPMNRLVQGDVGSGKTIVALVAALVAIENGYQAAFMAPTELLAEQHHRTISGFTEALGIRSVLLTGQVARAEKTAILAGLESGDIPLVVATHALIQDKVRIKALGLGIIDEQHRFGVLQRAALRTLAATEAERAPHILLMTATPIPRTLSMTVYGDLDVSALDELPPGRKPVRTVIFTQSQRQRVYDLVRQELDAGHQGYVVYPLVESSEKEDLQDATTMAHELGRTVFPNHRVGLVHGRMKGEEKDAVMRRFHAGDLHLLVSTTVIEVGVDVPNATIMVVEHAERFGLSQLHQLRGRVGRGSDRASCLLIAPFHRGGDVGTRLEAMRDTTDGFRIAEIDLQLRGPGEFLGTRQSGLPDFRVVNLLRDSRLLVEARRSAQQWMEGDPGFERPESDAMKIVLVQRWAKRLGLADVG